MARQGECRKDSIRSVLALIADAAVLLLLLLSACSHRAHRGLRHYWGLRVKGQHTKTTGRRGKTVGVSKKK